MRRKLFLCLIWIVPTVACMLTSIPFQPTSGETTPSANTALSSLTATVAPGGATSVTEDVPSRETPSLSQTASPAPSDTPLPTVERLKAKVTADLLSCRYGPGAEYLYLYALRKTASIELIGRTDANHWVRVAGKNKCWVNAKFLDIEGDPMRLPVVYPGIAKLPVSPYYPGPRWANATRKGDQVQVAWEAVPISPGKYESERMHQYIVEVWRCEGGQIIFETLGTNFPFITVERDEAGCSAPSHGKVFVQEKHGYGGPSPAMPSRSLQPIPILRGRRSHTARAKPGSNSGIRPPATAPIRAAVPGRCAT